MPTGSAALSPPADHDGQNSLALSALIVTDRADDVSLLLHTLRRDGLELTSCAVATIAAMQAALAGQPWDIVLADIDVPDADFSTILQTSKTDNPGRPVIVVCGPVGAEAAVELVRNGVADVILKGNLTRLAPAIRREIAAARFSRGMARDETAIVAAYRRVDAAEAMLRDAVDSISEGFVVFDAEDRLVLVNEAYRTLYPDVAALIRPGISFEELIRATLEIGGYADALGREDAWLAERKAQHAKLSGNTIQHLQDGRWLLVTERRMRNGGIAGLRMDISALKAAEAERDYLAFHDPITGLPNQTRFADRLEQALDTLEPAELIAVLGIELTSLTDIRASQGLEAGDAALRETGARLQAALPAGGSVAHVGNGRYLAFAMKPDGEQQVLATVAKLIEVSEAAFTFGGENVPLRIVVGGSTAPADGEQPETLIRNATTALRTLKANPLQRSQFYRAEMTKAAIQRWTIEAELRRAIERKEFVLHYQPQLDVRSYRIVGAEALIRWNHPERGLIPPGQFIPIAEETGLIVPLGEYALRQACAEAQTWHNDRGLGVPVAVNLSAVQLAEHNLEHVVSSILAETGLAPEMLKLELTESAILSDTAAATSTMQSLADRGVRFALDDFGMEHSSLSLLSRLPIENLKIDYAFICKMTEERAQAGLVQAIISMTHSLGMTAIAEGVERPDQLTYLQAYGCDALQGFLFSRPLPPETLREKLLAGVIAPPVP